MRRDVPSQPFKWHEPRKREAIEVRLKLITPMFGGGYTPRVVDPLMPIRPAAIRGHLRFWWRATAGAQYSNSQELYAAETEIWGGANAKGEPVEGKVVVQVEVEYAGTDVLYDAIAPRSTPREGPLHGYFLFPFQPQRDGTPAAVAKQDTTFRLRIQFHSVLPKVQREEVLKALRAWIAFGGVGARTRRGCGAITVAGPDAPQWLPPASATEFKQWFAALLPAGQVGRKLGFPSLVGASAGLFYQEGDAIAVWRELGRFWARFRKGHFRETYQPMRGAKWGDYRQVLCRLSPSQSQISLAKPFLGLPIIYQRIRGARNLCFVGTVEPIGSGRMASPVILKPVSLNNGGFAGLITVLQSPPPQAVRIKRDGESRAQECRLSQPNQDAVLKALNATEVLPAVISAAAFHFGNRWHTLTR